MHSIATNVQSFQTRNIPSKGRKVDIFGCFFYFGLIVNAIYVIALRRLQSFPKKANETNPKSHRALTKRMEGMNPWALHSWTLGGAPSSARGEEWSVDEKTWLIHGISNGHPSVFV